jgi:hypothetical protein
MPSLSYIIRHPSRTPGIIVQTLVPKLCSHYGQDIDFLMSKLPEKIQSATRELRKLQEEIQSPLSAAGPCLAELDSAALREFKTVIDYIRQLLWTYIQAEDLERGRNVDEEVLSLRLQRVTEMLHTIQEEVNNRQLATNPATVSFLNAVQDIADAAFQRHQASDQDEEEKAS